MTLTVPDAPPSRIPDLAAAACPCGKVEAGGRHPRGGRRRRSSQVSGGGPRGGLAGGRRGLTDGRGEAALRWGRGGGRRFVLRGRGGDGAGGGRRRRGVRGGGYGFRGCVGLRRKAEWLRHLLDAAGDTERMDTGVATLLAGNPLCQLPLSSANGAYDCNARSVFFGFLPVTPLKKLIEINKKLLHM